MMSETKLVGIYSGYVDAKPEPVRLTETSIECDEIWLSLWNVVDTGRTDERIQSNAASGNYDGEEDFEEIYWGFNGNPAHPLFPKNTTPGIGVDDAMDIFVRSNANKPERRVHYSCFKRVSIKQHNED